jgi:hypothetical protein
MFESVGFLRGRRWLLLGSVFGLAAMIIFGVATAVFPAQAPIAYVPVTVHASYAIRIDDKSMWKELVRAIGVGRLEGSGTLVKQAIYAEILEAIQNSGLKDATVTDFKVSCKRMSWYKTVDDDRVIKNHYYKNGRWYTTETVIHKTTKVLINGGKIEFSFAVNALAPVNRTDGKVSIDLAWRNLHLLEGKKVFFEDDYGNHIRTEIDEAFSWSTPNLTEWNLLNGTAGPILKWNKNGSVSIDWGRLSSAQDVADSADALRKVELTIQLPEKHILSHEVNESKVLILAETFKRQLTIQQDSTTNCFTSLGKLEVLSTINM